jgi:4-hydroxyacetophenone monooxygenase
MNAPLAADGIPEGLKGADDATIEAKVRAADVSSLRAALYQLTGDQALREMPIDRDARAAPDRMAPPALQREEDKEEVRRKAVDALKRVRDGSLKVPPPPSLEEYGSLAQIFFSEDLPESERRFWWEEFGVQAVPRAVPMDDVPAPLREEFNCIVIGGGMSAISAGVLLKAAGLPFTIVEQNPDLGGTWHRARYPGARVDVASFAYCNTYEPFYPWEHNFAVRDELVTYFKHNATKHDLWPHIRLSTKVTSLRWDSERKLWKVGVEGPKGKETLEARFVIAGMGLFGRVSVAQIAGMESFKGRLMHSAEWDESYALAGKRVAVIGTGSSGIQMVGPLSEQAKTLHIFQRTPAWIANMPGYDQPIPDAQRWLCANVPYYRNWLRLTTIYGIGDKYGTALDIDPNWKEPRSVNAANARLRDALLGYMKSKLGHRPDLLERCIPEYPPLAKRLPKDNGWYDAVLKDHVELVTTPIERITEKGIRTTDGKEYEFDMIVLATGYKTSEFLLAMDVQGDGVALKDFWAKDGARAYWGMTIPHFPNLFYLYGPNTNGRAVGPASWSELQVRYALKLMKKLMKSGKKAADVKEERYDEYNRELDRRLDRMIFSVPGRSGYFANEHGRVVTNGAFYNREVFAFTYEPEISDFRVS